MPKVPSLKKGAATKAGIVWERPPSELAKDFEIFGNALYTLAVAGAEDVAEDMQSYAKRNHPWTNRTGRAERGLHSDVISFDPGLPRAGQQRSKRTGRIVPGGPASKNKIEITLAHGKDVYYGIYLETMQGGRFAIILPTIQLYQFELLARLHNLAVDAAKSIK